jgi:hypothetical protein
VNDEQPLRKVPVALDELCAALDDANMSTGTSSTLEPVRGSWSQRCSMKTRPSSSSAEIDEADPGRYVEIPRADSHEAYRDMEDFIAAIGDERLQELLDVAIQGRGRSAASRMCWNGIPRSDSAGSIFRQRGSRPALGNGWPKNGASRCHRGHAHDRNCQRESRHASSPKLA